MRFIRYFLLSLALSGGFVAVGTAAEETDVYTVEEQGRSTLFSTFERRMPTSAEQWEYAREAQNKGRLKKADGRMNYLVRRWPNSKEAPWAQRARADMLFARGKLKKAFREYQYLIDNYSSRMLDYDSVLQSQFEIAMSIMKQRRMRWLFGGYRAPEYAVEYFEDVIRNGPQWDRAAEAQYLIGRCHQGAGELEMAVTAYGVLGYRYPDSKFAEEGAWQQIICLDKLRRRYPSSVDLLDRTLTATTVFLSTFPDSGRRGQIVQLRNKLYEVKAQKAFDEAEFYAKVPKKPEAAIIYYEQVIEEYPKSKLVPEARRRIDEIRGLMIPQAVTPAVSSTNALPEIKERESGDADQ